MSETNTTTPASSPAAPPAPPAVTPEHISALHRHLDQIGAFIKEGFERVIEFVKKEAPAVEAGAAAVGAAVPGAGPIVSVVEKVASTVASVVACICSCNANHSPKGCSAPGCACKAPNTLARATSPTP